ncbi:MAG: ATP-binding protein [Deltaproteobacteria bacterium]|nr:MAG: ATP-binding protein [Deltaproteobacteria bacterium]
MESIKRFFQGSQQSFFLFGPRGTGKSTWVRRHMPEAFLIDLLVPDQLRFYSAKPERLRDVTEAQQSVRTIVIDEVQKAPALLDVVHYLMEKHRDWRFVLTGSSARKLKRSGVDLLAGRAVLKEMHPFMAAELGDRFSLEKSLRFGLVPLVVSARNPAEAINAYTGLYLREEVQMEGLVRSSGDFSRFLESASFSHGAMLNISDVARDCEVGRKTVESYFAILEDLMLAFRVPVFSRRAKRHLAAHPKFYFFDPGAFMAVRPAGPLDRPQEIEGAALEGLVAQHLRAWAAYGSADAGLHYWRTKSGNEVDFVLYGRDAFCAIEVKNCGRLKESMVNGLLAFKADYPEAETRLVYRGRERIKIKGVLCVPCAEFLVNMVPGRPFWL